MEFDYRVHPGVSSNPNAPRMLEVAGYPEGFLEDAFANYADLGSAWVRDVSKI